MAEEMGIEAAVAVGDVEVAENKEVNGAKREREDEKENDDASKKQKVDELAEEERLQKVEGGEEEPRRVELGPKSFGSSLDMYQYFCDFLHSWPPKLNVNKYEHMVLLDLLKKGHSEPERKIGSGIRAFQVQFHPKFKNRCFFVIRDDASVDDFSFRKCVDNILPLPEDMKAKPGANKSHGGRGRGRGGKWRN